MRSGRTALLVITILMLAKVPAPARTAFEYDTAQRIVKACVVGVGGQTASNHPNPYLIEGMHRSHLRPDGWVFENPLAPATVVPQRDQEVLVKGNRDYWFVNLTDDNADRLIGMDLIYLADGPRDAMSITQQEGLLAAVEAGAILWIDGPQEPGLLNDLGPFEVGYQTLGDTGFTRVPADRGHGLLREPHPLSDTDVARLGDFPNRDAYDEDQWTVPGSYLVDVNGLFDPVIEVGTINAVGQIVDREPFIISAQYGSGSIIVSTGGVGRDVSGWIVPRGEAGGAHWRSTPDFLQAPDVKLALNMVQWNDRWQQARRTPRGTVTSIARVPMPLDIGWQYPGREDLTSLTALGAVVSTPVYDRGMVYAVSLPHDTAGIPAQLIWFDIEPGRDLSGDGQPDDGRFIDYTRGASYDRIHRVELHGGDVAMSPRFSSPTLTSYQEPDGDLYPHVVLVSYVDRSTGVGWVDCYDASIQTDEPERLWRRQIQPYNPGSGEVVALSTPVVHNGFVYLLSTEMDGAPYGRVHCFELNYPWAAGDPWPGNAAWWVYPSHLADIDGAGSPPDEPEMIGLLPPFHDPAWVMMGAARPHLPPSPGSIPVVHSAVIGVDGIRVDAAVTFGTPVSHRWDGADISIDLQAGGTQYTLIPTPMRPGDLMYALNAEYHLVRTNREMAPDGYGDTVLAIDPGEEVPGTQRDVDYIRYNPGTVREAIIEAVEQGANPLEAQRGIEVLVSYDDTDSEAHTLPGPVRWQQALRFGQEVAQPAAVSADEIVVAASPPADGTLPVQGGEIMRLDGGSGGVKWSYDPRMSMPDLPLTANAVGITAPAIDDESIIIGATGVAPGMSASSVIGLHRQVDVSVDLLNPPAPGDEPVQVRIAGTELVISPSSYNVDPWLQRLTFPASTAGEVRLASGDLLGSIYGVPVTIEWPDGSLEDHLLPPIERFHHTWGYIRLRNYPVDWGSEVAIRRPDGTLIDDETYAPITQARFGEGSADVSDECSLDGWIDMREAVDVNGVEVLPGDELLVSYTGWMERDHSGDGEPEGFVTVPNAAMNLPAEVHQMAVQFGAPNAPAMAGNAIHMGTGGLDSNLSGSFETPQGPQHNDTDTMLSLLWNRATGFVRSSLMTPAEPQDGVTGVPVVSSSPSVANDWVFVGSRMMDAPNSDAIGYGYVSALKPWRVLIADSNRIVETTGSRPSWICTGTMSPQSAQSFVGEDLRRPFNRPAKAMHLPSGNVLVVDTGNHRVVEIDRAGRIVWPLDIHGYEYYTSQRNNNLKLSRPADAHRYEDYEGIDFTGNGDPDGYFPVLRTVIADTGNARVINITTRFMYQDPATGDWVRDGRQHHTVETVTPSYVRIRPERGPERVRYTSAQPIRDPENNAVVGYLCAASNLNQLLVVEAAEERRVNPFGDLLVQGGSGDGENVATWAQWAWLYDHEPGSAPYVSNQGLIFENIRHAEYRRHGDTIYLTVTAGRYVGREGFLYCRDPECLERAPANQFNPGDTCPDPACDGPLHRQHHMAAAGAGVFEFAIDVSGGPDTWRLATTSSDDQPHWYFVGRYETPASGLRTDYADDMTTIAAQGQTISKQWYPVSAQRLPSGRHLIVNSLNEIESFTPGNVGDRSAVLGAHIFEVSTTPGATAHDDVHDLEAERSVPAPGEVWADPFTQPAYAESR